MSLPEIDEAMVRRLVIDTILGSEFRRATFGGAARHLAASPWVRVIIRPLELRGKRSLQFSYFDQKKNFTRNLSPHEIAAPLDELLAVGFAGIHLSSQTAEVDIRRTRKGKILIGRKKQAPVGPEPLAPHNRVKAVPLPEGRANRLLEVMGILTHEGQVRPTMRAKFTQINEFLKHLGHVLDAAALRGLDRRVEILDCGCGSSYLTLAVHHYLNEVLAIPANIVGVDVNEELIRKSVDRSERLGASHLAFECRRIGAGDAKPDIVLALHACDTATDDAIAQAIAVEAKILLSVPCCHHDLNGQLRAEGPTAVLRALLRHGILQQRTADLITDAFRALVLRIMGYRTEVVEFISPEHTARNLMIRAVRGAVPGEAEFVREYLQLRRFWGVTPYLERVLGEPFQKLLQNAPVRES